MLFMPFVAKLLGYLKFSKYCLRNKYFVLSSLLLVMFVSINYSVTYFYNLNDEKSLTYSIVPALMTLSMFFTGFFLNYRKMPFYPYNIMIVNISLFCGGILWVFLSVGQYFLWTLSPVDLLFSKDSLSELYNSEARKIASFWSPDVFYGGPTFDIFSCLGISLSGMIFSKSLFSKDKKENILLFLILTLIFSMSLYSSVAIGSRTPVLVMTFSFFISYIYTQYKYVFLSHSSSHQKRLSKLLVYASIIILFLIFFSVVTNFNLADVFKDTNFGYRLAEKGLETDRYDAWLSAIDQMFEYPWGGRFMKLPDGLRYVHNIWLDQLYDTGIIPMILLMAFHILQIPIFFDFLKLNLPRTLNLFFISIIIALLAAFVQAPVLQASFPFFASSCFFFGSIMKLTIDSRVLRYSM
jgi:hypothetical protein